MPLLDEVSDSFEVEPEVVLADAGYCNEADLVALEERGIDGYVAGREGKARVAVDPHTRAATHRMGEKLARAKGKAQYAKRKWMSEGPNGWVKEVLGVPTVQPAGLGQGAGRMAPGVPCAEHQRVWRRWRVMRAVGRAAASGSAWRGCVMTRRVRTIRRSRVPIVRCPPPGQGTAQAPSQTR